MKLNTKYIQEKFPGKEVKDVVSVNVSNSDVSHVDSLKDCEKLHKLDLSKNSIKKSDALSGLRKVKSLTWLNVSNNGLTDCTAFDDKFSNLLVLNVSNNEINSLGPNFAGLKSLNALILNNNNIGSEDLQYLKGLDNLNTIVISHNPLVDSLDQLPPLPSLVKISCTNCNVTSFPLDITKKFPKLKELRLSGNKITSIPMRAFKTLGLGAPSIPAEARTGPSQPLGSPTPLGLQILELGNNPIEDIEDISMLKHVATTLYHLSLKGTGLAKKYSETEADVAVGNVDEESGVSAGGYRSTILTIVPNLRILDGIRFDTKFIERRKKRQELEIKLKEMDEKQKNHDAKVKRLELKAKNSKKMDHIQQLEAKLKTLDSEYHKNIRKVRNTGGFVKPPKPAKDEKSSKDKKRPRDDKKKFTSVKKVKKTVAEESSATPATTAEKVEKVKKVAPSKKEPTPSEPTNDGGDDFFMSAGSGDTKISSVQKEVGQSKAQRQRQRQKLKKKST